MLGICTERVGYLMLLILNNLKLQSLDELLELSIFATTIFNGIKTTRLNSNYPRMFMKYEIASITKCTECVYLSVPEVVKDRKPLKIK